MSIGNFITKDDRILVIAPHPDDEILGCGGLLAYAADIGTHVDVLFLTVSGFTPFNGGNHSDLETRLGEVRAVVENLKVHDYDFFSQGDEKHLKLDSLPIVDIISWIEKGSKCSMANVNPTLILVPSDKHNHQDHIVGYRAALATLRTNPFYQQEKVIVLAYEVPGTGQTGFPSFNPTLYIELSESVVGRKCRLFELYASQVAKPPRLRSVHAIRTLAQFRGLDAGYYYAEAYEILRMKISNMGR